MRHHQADQHQRYSNHVQGEEAVERNVGNVKVAANPSGQIRADYGDGAEQINDYLRTPKRHLAPRQQVAHKGLCHQGEENQRAAHPHEFAWFFERAVNQAAEHVQIHHDEEHRGAGRVHIADNPAAGHIAHDVFHCGKRSRQMVLVQVTVWLVVHGEEDAADNLNHQHQQGQRTEEIPKIEVFRCVIFGYVFLHHSRKGETRVHPIEQCFGFIIGLIGHDLFPGISRLRPRGWWSQTGIYKEESPDWTVPARL